MSATAGLASTGILGGGTGLGPSAVPASLGEILDLYIFHFVVSLLYIIGGIMLMDRFAANIGKASGWDDFFYAYGAVTFILNAAVMAAIIYAWLSNRSARLTRKDDRYHWVHGLSIFTAAFSVVWSVLALIMAFGAVIGGTNSDSVETAGYFLVLFTGVYFTYLTVRYALGLAKGGPDAAVVGVVAPTAVDINAVLAAARGIGAGNTTSAQPLFGGGSGMAAFGGLDLSGLQPSSVSTIPHQQSALPQQQYSGGGGGYAAPIIVMPQMMSPQQQIPCQTDQNAVYIP